MLEKLIFACPRCESVKRTYSDIFDHIKRCEGKDALPDAPLPSEIIGSTPMGPGSLMPAPKAQ